MFAETELPGDENGKWKMATAVEANSRWLEIFSQQNIFIM